MGFNWTVTVNSPPSGGATGFEHTVWLGTPPQINLNDGSLPFSACAILFTDWQDGEVWKIWNGML